MEQYTRRAFTCAQRRNIKPQATGNAGTPALDEDVGTSDETSHFIAVGGVAEIERDAPFSPIEDGGGSRHAGSQGISSGRLDPDDIRAVVGQHPGEPGACGAMRAVHDP